MELGSLSCMKNLKVSTKASMDSLSGPYRLEVVTVPSWNETCHPLFADRRLRTKLRFLSLSAFSLNSSSASMSLMRFMSTGIFTSHLAIRLRHHDCTCDVQLF